MRADNLLAIRALLRQRYQREFTQPMPAESVVSEVEAINQLEDKSTSKPDEQPNSSLANNVIHQAFLLQVNRVLAQHYTDDGFNVDAFASEMALGKRQLSRKMKVLLDLSPAESIRSFRLKKAAELLLSGVSPSVVSHQVGFSSHSYFSQCFKAQYDCLPSNYAG